MHKNSDLKTINKLIELQICEEFLLKSRKTMSNIILWNITKENPILENKIIRSIEWSDNLTMGIVLVIDLL